jgi:hypothetical protein
VNQSDEYYPEFSDKEEAIIQRLAEACDSTRDEVINALSKEFFKLIDQATDETQLPGFARMVKKALTDAALRN